MRDRILQRLGGLDPTVPLVAGLQVELEAAENAAIGAARLIQKIDETIGHLSGAIAGLESIKQELLAPGE